MTPKPAAHTPTFKNGESMMLPWCQGDSTREDDEGDNACNVYDVESGANCIAKCENPEDAAFIVRAVNAHEELEKRANENFQSYERVKDELSKLSSEYKALIFVLRHHGTADWVQGLINQAAINRAKAEGRS